MIKVLVGQYPSEFSSAFLWFIGRFYNLIFFPLFAGVQSKRLESHPVQLVDQDRFRRATDAEAVADVDRRKVDVASRHLPAVRGLTVVQRHLDVVSRTKIKNFFSF